ncbi:hypothetical protein CTEN210_18305 [Chaetoceros tenuissimus]|uniref:HSF-type DNA-binding domain-containing protein n=1 Tax=Chaetoceros tenuissimus TaxID=426638 RepID=A0AAD3DFR6_9STRA|nr:hypothetical protein CTEN210_18305 [Chaetoceros tenuissimus]
MSFDLCSNTLSYRHFDWNSEPILYQQQAPIVNKNSVSTPSLIETQNNWTSAPPHSKEEEQNRDVPIICTKGGVKAPFPVKLMDLLNLIDTEEPDLACIISWMPSENSFMVKDKNRFEKEVQRYHFDQTNYTSFRRQLNLWGFKRVDDKHSLDYGAYFHPMFHRDDKYSCRLMRRPTPPTILSKKNKAKAPTKATKRVSSVSQNDKTKKKTSSIKKSVSLPPPVESTLAIRIDFNVTSPPSCWSFNVPQTPDQIDDFEPISFNVPQTQDQIDEFEPIIDESQCILPQETVSLFLVQALQNSHE